MGNNWNSERCYFWGAPNIADGDCCHEIKRCLLLGRKAMRKNSEWVKVTQLCLTLYNPMDLAHAILQTRILDWVAIPFSMGSFQPRDWTQVSQFVSDSLPAESQGKPKNTGVGSLSLLQGIFPTQESNQGLLHCRWILYQLSFDGSPN